MRNDADPGQELWSRVQSWRAEKYVMDMTGQDET